MLVEVLLVIFALFHFKNLITQLSNGSYYVILANYFFLIIDLIGGRARPNYFVIYLISLAKNIRLDNIQWILSEGPCEMA